MLIPPIQTAAVAKDKNRARQVHLKTLGVHLDQGDEMLFQPILIDSQHMQYVPEYCHEPPQEQKHQIEHRKQDVLLLIGLADECLIL